MCVCMGSESVREKMRKRKEERKKEKRIWAVPSGITRWRRNTGNGITVPNSPRAGEEIARGDTSDTEEQVPDPWGGEG